MKSLISLILPLLLLGTINAQEGGGFAGFEAADASGFSGLSINSSFGRDFLNQMLDGKYSGQTSAYDNIEGSPFINEEPVEAELVLSNGQILHDAMIQMDLYTGDVILTMQDSTEVVLNKLFLAELRLPVDGQPIVMKKLNPSDISRFYTSLYENDSFKFFKETYVTKREGANQGLAEVKTKFFVRNKYYVQHENNEIIKVTLKANSILETFSSDNAKKIKAYAKDNSFKLKKEEHYIRAFRNVL